MQNNNVAHSLKGVSDKGIGDMCDIISDMCFRPGKHMSLERCVPLPGKRISLVICVALHGKPYH